MNERFKKWLPLFLLLAASIFILKPWQRRGTDTQHMVHITEDSFDEQVVAAQQPVLVDFWAAWCGPCRLLTPTLDELAKEYEGRIVFAKINVDEETTLSDRFHIRAIPNVFLFVDGKPVDSFQGVRSKSSIRKWLDKQLESVTPTS